MKKLLLLALAASAGIGCYAQQKDKKTAKQERIDARMQLEEENDPPFKRVCARYGLAMYFVQVLEHGIVNALVWLDLYKKTGGRWTAEEFDRYNESRFGDTLPLNEPE